MQCCVQCGLFANLIAPSGSEAAGLTTAFNYLNLTKKIHRVWGFACLRRHQCRSWMSQPNRCPVKNNENQVHDQQWSHACTRETQKANNRKRKATQ